MRIAEITIWEVLPNKSRSFVVKVHLWTLARSQMINLARFTADPNKQYVLEYKPYGVE